MQTFYDYKKFGILYVDDEEKSLKSFKTAFGDRFRIFTANNAAEGFKIFEEHKDELGILMSDQRMPGEKGVQLLERARQLRPRILRILATAYADTEAAVQAVNQGAIYRYVHKPWDPQELDITLKRGLEFFTVQRERDQLLKEKLSVLHNMMITDRVVSLGILAAGLSHHVRNSLVAVRTFLDLAPAKLQAEKVDLEQLRNPNYWRDFYDHVQVQVRRITEMLNDLGSASENQKLLFGDRVEIKPVVENALAKMKERIDSKKIRVELDFPPGLPALTVDQPKFEQIFSLLFKDELVNLPDGSTIRVRGSSTPGEGGKPAQVNVEIEDNGNGLPEESLRSVFDPFFLRQDNPQEFGIDLMASYFLVYHHGGKIEVKPAAERGTVFTLSFPIIPQPPSPGQDDRDFISKVLMNETLWERLLAGG
jgi:two-component system probable response regulator PhcQ